jgi:hypothetical protein
MKNQTAMAVLATTMTLALSMATARAQPPAADKPAEKPAAAAPAAAPEVPKPAPENEVIKRSAGTWTCQGTAKPKDGPEMKYKSTWTIKPITGGHWYSILYKRSKSGPMPAFEGHATVGYNTAEKKYWFVGVDNMGSWINLTSPDGATYTGEGAPMAKKSPVKFSFTPGKDKKGQESDRLFDATLEFEPATSTESCKK